jgi:hypothetical protein
MANAQPAKQSGEQNLLWALVLIVVACTATALATWWICDFVIEGFQDSSTMALLITDAGVKSDDAKLQGQLSSATMALKTCRDLGLALALGCFGVGVAVMVRIWRKRAS